MPPETDKIYLHKVLNPLPRNTTKWSDTLKIQQHLLQDFKSVSDHSTTMQSKWLSIPGLTRLNIDKPLF